MPPITFARSVMPTKADQWIDVIDRPRKTGHYLAVNNGAVKRMQSAAVDVQESYGSYIYIFEDGSSLYEKRNKDRYPGDSYIQCPSCEEWNRLEDYTQEANGLTDLCAECYAEDEADDEEATAILKSEFGN